MITFEGIYAADRGQAAAVTFYTFCGGWTLTQLAVAAHVPGHCVAWLHSMRALGQSIKRLAVKRNVYKPRSCFLFLKTAATFCMCFMGGSCWCVACNYGTQLPAT